MCAIIKREVLNYLKNPIYWIGLLLMLVGLYLMLSPYLQIQHFDNEQQLKALEADNIGDRDIMEGYVPSTEEERKQTAYECFAEEMASTFGMSDEEIELLIAKAYNTGLPMREQSNFLFTEIWTNYAEAYNGGSVSGLEYWYEISEIHKGDVKEINEYIDKSLENRSFSWYFSRKYADFCGVFMGFSSAVLLAFLFIRDTKRDMYELLHTKPISAKKFIVGKVCGGFCSILILWGVMTLLFDVICEVYGRSQGFPTSFLDFIVTAIVYILPNMLMITCIYTAAALVFKNPLPAVPAIFLYMIYSNMGSTNAEGVYGYYGRPLAIMVRFPGRFFEITPPPFAASNQMFLLLASVVLIVTAIFIWKRKRVY